MCQLRGKNIFWQSALHPLEDLCLSVATCLRRWTTAKEQSWIKRQHALKLHLTLTSYPHALDNRKETVPALPSVASLYFIPECWKQALAITMEIWIETEFSMVVVKVNAKKILKLCTPSDHQMNGAGHFCNHWQSKRPMHPFQEDIAKDPLVSWGNIKILSKRISCSLSTHTPQVAIEYLLKWTKTVR